MLCTIERSARSMAIYYQWIGFLAGHRSIMQALSDGIALTMDGHVLTQLSFESHWLLFSHASAEVRSKNKPERKFASTGYHIHNHQVMSPICSPLSHPGRSEAGGRANDGIKHGSIDSACATEN